MTQFTGRLYALPDWRPLSPNCNALDYSVCRDHTGIPENAVVCVFANRGDVGQVVVSAGVPVVIERDATRFTPAAGQAVDLQSGDIVHVGRNSFVVFPGVDPLSGLGPDSSDSDYDDFMMCGPHVSELPPLAGADEEEEPLRKRSRVIDPTGASDTEDELDSRVTASLESDAAIEPEPAVAVHVPVPEPEPVVAVHEAVPEPEPVVAVHEAVPEPEPVVAVHEAVPEPEPAAGGNFPPHIMVPLAEPLGHVLMFNMPDNAVANLDGLYARIAVPTPRDVIEHVLREHGAMSRAVLSGVVHRSLAARPGSVPINHNTLQGYISKYPYRVYWAPHLGVRPVYIHYHPDVIE